jgi:hypothetical protein
MIRKVGRKNILGVRNYGVRDGMTFIPKKLSICKKMIDNMDKCTWALGNTNLNKNNVSVNSLKERNDCRKDMVSILNTAHEYCIYNEQTAYELFNRNTMVSVAHLAHEYNNDIYNNINNKNNDSILLKLLNHYKAIQESPESDFPYKYELFKYLTYIKESDRMVANAVLRNKIGLEINGKFVNLDMDSNYGKNYKNNAIKSITTHTCFEEDGNDVVALRTFTTKDGFKISKKDLYANTGDDITVRNKQIPYDDWNNDGNKKRAQYISGATYVFPKKENPFVMQENNAEMVALMTNHNIRNMMCNEESSDALVSVLKDKKDVLFFSVDKNNKLHRESHNILRTLDKDRSSLRLRDEKIWEDDLDVD